MVCLETSFLIDLFRGDKSAVEYWNKLNNAEAITVASPTILELATGAELSSSPKEKRQLKEFLSSITVLPLDQKSALLAGEINAELITGGEMIEITDVQIAAVTITHQQTLVTRNTKHFSRVPRLDIEKYA
jgi:tRNA(fMet)-specific endonuclease VapC